MSMRRREFIAVGAAAIAAAAAAPRAIGQEGGRMYGLIGKMTAAPGRREELIAILITGVAGMPGCLSDIVAEDAADANAIYRVQRACD